MSRFYIGLAALLVSGSLLWLALLLGSVGYEARKAGLHEGRLRRMLEQKPRAESVGIAFENEGTRHLGSAWGALQMRRIARRFAGADAPRIQKAGAAFAQSRVFKADDTVYFIFFDEAGVMGGYAWIRAGF